MCAGTGSFVVQDKGDFHSGMNAATKAVTLPPLVTHLSVVTDSLVLGEKRWFSLLILTAGLGYSKKQLLMGKFLSILHG